MGKIQQLDTTLSNIIAAGEVIESPVNIIKELVENSIDANSTSIKIYLEESGIKKIKIVDDGSGMDLDDLRMCFLPHATSKIKNEFDLVRVKSLGFRGEAIASICSVSMMTIESITNESKSANSITYKFGKKEQETISSLSVGTTITVERLFHNTPVRLKYLRSPERERASILYLVGKLALTHPNISFYLENDGKELFRYNSRDGINILLRNLYGQDIVKDIVNTKSEANGTSVNIYYLKPNNYRSNKLHITYIINDRYIKDHHLNEALINAFDTYLPIGKYPIAVVYITIDPLLVDVNVHPKKSEIRIADEHLLCEQITKTLKNSLESTSQIKEEKVFTRSSDFEIFKAFTKENTNDVKDSFKPNLFFETNTYHADEVKEEKSNIADVINNSLYEEDENPIKIEEEPKTLVSRKLPYFSFIGIFNKTYIILEYNNDLYLLDQHAAAERINYEYYLNILANNNQPKTSLLFPLSISLSYDEAIYVESNLDKFSEIGFTLDSLGNNSFAIREIPLWAKDLDHNEIIYNVIEMIVKEKDISIKPFRDKICKQISCKKSIKANDVISKTEVLYLIDKLDKCDNPYHCPHGRPTFIKFTSNDIKKMFERIQS